MSLVKGGVILNCCPLSLSSSSSSSSSSSPCNGCPWSWKGGVSLVQGRKELPSMSSLSSFAMPKRFLSRSRGFHVGAFLFDPTRDPIIKDALKEPVAFMGGMFAGLLRLDLNEDPLREWIARTAEAAGIAEEETETGDTESEGTPQQIEIE